MSWHRREIRRCNRGTRHGSCSRNQHCSGLVTTITTPTSSVDGFEFYGTPSLMAWVRVLCWPRDEVRPEGKGERREVAHLQGGHRGGPVRGRPEGVPRLLPRALGLPHLGPHGRGGLG